MIRHILAAAVALFFLAAPVGAQQTIVVQTCGVLSPLYVAGVQGRAITIDVNGNQCGNATVIGVEQPDVNGTFTNATQTTSVVSTSQDGYGTVLISINGVYGTASAVFEMSDDSGTTWYPISVARADGSGADLGYTSLTNLSRAWIIPVAGMDLVRVRSTAVASGTVNVKISSTSVQTSPIPQIVTQVTNSATGTTGAVAATLPAAANRTTYICGFTVSSSGATTPTAVNVTVANTISGTLNFTYSVVAVATDNQVPLTVNLAQANGQCVAANAVNTAIVVTQPGIGAGGTAAATTAWGYQQ